ncbi:MAG: hypothetical protein K2N48_12165, partial [Muribaculaceae bacterium]|nr:hypothetical protein [Muribaculaceae bacterium]
MLRKVLIAIVAGMCFAGLVSAKVIKSPDYDFRKSGTLKVTEVERTKDATRLTFTAKFKPKGWITLNPTEVEISLPGDTVKVKPIALDASFNYDEKYFMPESGETVFTVTYPPLPKSVKKIDTGATTNWAIWGIDIAGKGKKADKDARTVTVKPYRPIETIFEADTITVSGFIKGYNRQRSGISVLQLYVEDLAVRNSKPVAIPIKADGSFSRRFLLPMAQTAMMSANVKGISLGVYLEPHNDLEIMIDYDKLLESESTGKGKNDAIRFGGSLGTINNELIASPCSPYIRGWQLDAKMPIDEAKLKIAETYSGIYDTCEKYIAEAKVSEKAAEIMRNTAEVQRLVCMFYYAEKRSNVDA